MCQSEAVLSFIRRFSDVGLLPVSILLAPLSRSAWEILRLDLPGATSGAGRAEGKNGPDVAEVVFTHPA
ncbi:hypothetical protein Pla52o_16350 [Novipirellula galeiformis]|uniref:Uncharacterized protein n=1 Tax=Novipirellula galeiformis TaxID=2528004 RepID=A0A5C6CMN4_9BACT|nr:hypothetical protein Pla52o_16350 [Novipirellula galeiformis]